MYIKPLKLFLFRNLFSLDILWNSFLLNLLSSFKIFLFWLSDITSSITTAQRTNKPSLISCKTIIGLGSPNLAGTEKTHGAPLGQDEVKEVKTQQN